MTHQAPVLTVPLAKKLVCGTTDISLKDYRLQVFEQVSTYEKTWSQATKSGGVFWSSGYLETLENNYLPGVQPVYALLSLSNTVVGAFYFQRKKVQTSEAFHSDGSARTDSMQCLRGLIQSRLNFDVLFCGNILLTGSYGILQTSDVTLSANVLDAVFETVATVLGKKTGRAPNLILVKDLKQDNNLPFNEQYKSFCTLPDMVVPIAPHWQGFDDYLADMSSKYRTRTRRALKKLAPFSCVELDEHLLELHAHRLSFLFNNVVGEADLSLVKLPTDYFYKLKRALGDDFVVWGYFDASKQLVGFQSAFLLADHVDAHYVGYTNEANEQHQVYLNMLYRYVELAIDQKARLNPDNQFELKFARTAMEIKSSVGAVPQTIFCYFKHRRKTFNGMLHLLTDYMYQLPAWQPRHPFDKK
jgi:hypothetical protein